MSKLTDRQKEFFSQIEYRIDLIASRHATPESILGDLRLLKMRFVRIDHFPNAEDLEDIFEGQAYADRILRAAVNRCALLLTEETKRLSRRSADISFKNLLEQVAAVNVELDDLLTVIQEMENYYPEPESDTLEWYESNKKQLETLKRQATAGSSVPAAFARQR